jgi:hypothetical protein
MFHPIKVPGDEMTPPRMDAILNAVAGMSKMREHLVEGGPPVNDELVCLYTAGVLSGQERAAVSHLVATYFSWNDRFFEYAAAEAQEKCLPPVTEVDRAEFRKLFGALFPNGSEKEG